MQLPQLVPWHADSSMDGKFKSQQVNKKKDDRWRNFKEKAQERIDNKNWKEEGYKEDLGFERKREMDRRKENKFTDFEVIETDGMYSCRTEYTSSSWPQEMLLLVSFLCQAGPSSGLMWDPLMWNTWTHGVLQWGHLWSWCNTDSSMFLLMSFRSKQSLGLLPAILTGTIELAHSVCSWTVVVIPSSQSHHSSSLQCCLYLDCNWSWGVLDLYIVFQCNVIFFPWECP